MNSVDINGKTIYILDAYGLIYQVFHTIRDISSPQGEPTGATFGFIRDILALLSNHRPDYLFCAFDLPKPTFRHSIFPQYKANRDEMPDDLKLQIQFIREFLYAAGIKILELQGYEADDIMATIAIQTAKQSGNCVLVTSDKDARQLISSHIQLYNIRKQQFYAEKELYEDWGIRPDQVIDFQTMVGDMTDNIAGIPKIGVKTASKLLQEFDSLENIYRNIDQLKGVQKSNIEKSREITNISRQLVQLKTDVPLDIDWTRETLSGVDPDYLLKLFKYFGFKSLIPQIEKLTQKLGKASLPELYSSSVLLNSFERNTKNLFSYSSDLTSSNKNDLSQNEKTVLENDLQENEEFDLSMPLFLHWNQNTKSSNNNDLKNFEASLDSNSQSDHLLNSNITKKLFQLISQNTNNAFIKDENAQDPSLQQPTFFPELPERNIETFSGQNPLVGTPQYHLIDSTEKFDAFWELLSRQTFFSIDLETTNIRPRFARIVGIAICFDAQNAYYLPFRGPLGSKTLDETEILEKLRSVLENPHILKLGQNIKYDWIVLKNCGISLQGVVFDTMIADYLLHAGSRNHNLDDMAENYLNHKTIKISELIGTGKNQKQMDSIPTNVVAEYAGEDALIPWLLYPILIEKLKEQPGLLKLLTDLEIPLIKILVEMEFMGIAINSDHFKKLAVEFDNRLKEIEQQIHLMAKDVDADEFFAMNFNINSTQQLQRILFDDLKLPVIKKTKTGRSTDIEVLEELANLHPLPEKLIEHRHITKLKGTYIDPLPILVHPKTQRIHASFNQVVTATGRLSSSDPNLQNIPVRNEEGKKIRQGFIPDISKGFDCMLSCDYSQIELRVLSHFSNDENLKAAFLNDLDIHNHVASTIFNVSADSVTSEMRRKAKAVNFGLIYGQSAFGLSKSINIPREEAAAYIQTFFDTYPGIQIFFDTILENCHRNGYVQTLLGRKRQIEGVRGPRGAQQLNMPERTAINTVIQGSAADLMKLAMLKVYRRLYKTTPETTPFPSANSDTNSILDKEVPFAPEKTQMLLQIHDELVFETNFRWVEELKQIVITEMELGQPLSVPLKIDADIANNWGDI